MAKRASPLRLFNIRASGARRAAFKSDKSDEPMEKTLGPRRRARSAISEAGWNPSAPRVYGT
jgi:hypothetical protein